MVCSKMMYYPDRENSQSLWG